MAAVSGTLYVAVIEVTLPPSSLAPLVVTNVGDGGAIVYEALTFVLLWSLVVPLPLPLSLGARDLITLDGVTIVYDADTCSGGDASFWRRNNSRNSPPAVGGTAGTRSFATIVVVVVAAAAVVAGGVVVVVPKVTVVTLSFWD